MYYKGSSVAISKLIYIDSVELECQQRLSARGDRFEEINSKLKNFNTQTKPLIDRWIQEQTFHNTYSNNNPTNNTLHAHPNLNVPIIVIQGSLIHSFVVVLLPSHAM